MLRHSTTTVCRYFRYPIFILVCTAALSACDVHFKTWNVDEDKAQALVGVKKFRVLYEKHDYAHLYDLGSAAMKASMSKDQFISAARISMAQYGKYESSVLVGSSCFPNEVRLVYDAKYQNANVREHMIWSVSSGPAKLTMYQVGAVQVQFDKASQVGCPVP
ncbi:hypothetical protein INH39_05700 [Massilia violaceinigra]|uniref:Lipoprotein n=1 Tax=Massilia violaceinigra TaxID=2045208 RepID=A0ABY4ACA2_9BURK|nr:hypothetical protein [Massilia violaceinigra]UOD31211.1 hypothetical protein INH39_05700 [Massilia violaceinigra]